MSAERRRSLGTVMTWIGVLAWAPFFFLVAAGQAVSVVPFLAGHLIGVLSGAYLRASADRMEGIDRAVHGRLRRRLSMILIYAGVLAWVPYIYMKRIQGLDVNVTPYLAAHLTGVLSGIAVRASIEMERWRERA